MNIGMWLERVALSQPDKPAVYLGDRLVATYGEFHDQAAQLASWLRAAGIGPGDRVAIYMKNCPGYIIALYGAWYAGAAAVPINAKLHAREAAFILGDAGAKLCFATSDLTGGLERLGTGARVMDADSAAFAAIFDTAEASAPVARRPDDLAWLFYTSGTTGTPKGVMITHGMLSAMSLSYLADVDAVGAQDATFYAAPMSHGAGLYMMVHVLKAARHVCMPSGGFDPEEIFFLARQFGSVHLFAAPTMVRRLSDFARSSGATGEGLRTVVYAGGPMYLADIEEAVDRFGPIFVQIYGQGECPMSITALSRQDVADRSHPRWRARLGSVGQAQSVVEVRVGDASGQAVACGQSGEIMVRGATVMPGYWNNPEGTAKTFINGWLLTGDMGHMDADGYVTLQDRSRDMIISGGSNIYPREVEEVLLRHASVREVSVVGRRNAEWGEDVVAFVVPRSQEALDENALDAHCLDHIARFKRPKAYFRLSELPKNNYGKVLKTELRQRLEEMKDD